MTPELAIRTFLAEYPQFNKFCVAYSGGLDSSVLLHLMRQCKDICLRAIHIHHGLSKLADDWQQHCEAVCKAYAIELTTIRVNATAEQGESPEATARQVRYQALAKSLAADECLLVAHHQRDQAETVLLQAFRGTGVRGMAAMPRLKQFADAYLARPLLSCEYQLLRVYAQQHRLVWVEDDSNIDVKFDRNLLRQQILPQVRQRWPALDKNLARLAHHSAQTQELLDEVAATDIQQCQFKQRSCLDIKAIQNLSMARQTNLLRYWLCDLGYPLPSAVQLQRIISELFPAAADRQPRISYQHVDLRRYQGRIYAMPQDNFEPITEPIVWDMSTDLQLPQHMGYLNIAQLMTAGLSLPQRNEAVSVRFRQGGEKIQPQGRQGSHRLKKLFQEWRIPPWQRDRIPLVYYENQLVAVVGYCVAEQYYTKD